ncbi:MAG TPA: stage II sporulation protein M [Chitinophagaceae bacterium]|nr:stage II sporulation protein M [Chitinophagaceae bacterium]
MREGLFIKKNKDRWERVEHETVATPDEMAKDFTQLVDDLAYAKTFYPTSRITKYLNSLASRIYLGIYQNRKEKSNRLVHFFKYDVPFTIGKHRVVMLFALAVFLLFFSVGFFSSLQDEGFVRQVLGDAYVEMTEKNIEEGNPFNVYADSNPVYMWVRIMINNIMVSFSYFFRGILFGIPSIAALARESIRLGAFEHMFYVKGLGAQAVVTVLLHGMLELTAIIITCGAGVIMGKSFLFPGTYSRLKSLQEGAKDGVKIVVGLVPIFIVAAFIEGFITRYYKMPLWMSLSFLFVCAVFIIWYFIILPGMLYRKKYLNQH